MKHHLVAALLGICATPAFAGSIEARLAGGTSEIDDGVDKLEYDSTGFDLRGSLNLNPNFFVRGSILSVSSDEVEFQGDTFDAEIETTIFRFGGGYETTLGSIVGFGALEYGKVELELEGDGDDDKGAVISLGLKDSGAGAFLWQVELGYLSLKDNKGATLDLTLGYRATPSLAIVGGLQSYAVKDDEFDEEFTVGNAFIGGRFSF